jgi:hypothetical protein
MHAYEHGVVVECADLILRRLYPRLFTYSADYPEKYVLSGSVLNSEDDIYIFRILLASIKNLGRCPCPRCLTEKIQVPGIGTIPDSQRRERLARVDDIHHQEDVDLARKFIFDNGAPVTGAHVEAVLNAESRVPTRVSQMPLCDYKY